MPPKAMAAMPKGVSVVSEFSSSSSGPRILRFCRVD